MIKNNQRGFVGILLAIVVVLVVAGGGYYLYQQQTAQGNKPATSDNTGLVTTTRQEEGSFSGEVGEGVRANVNIQTNVTQTVDCGSEDCFQQKFAACQPATLLADADFAAVSYKIIEPTSGGCKMTVKYTTNPNPDWVNKEMTCTFDNKADFQTSMEKAFNGVISGTVICQGPLYNILRNPQ